MSLAGVLLASFPPGLALAAGVAAIAIPLLIHLLFRKQHRIVPWAAIRFLFHADRLQRRRVDQWLLLLLRVALLLLPLLAMIADTPWAENLWQAIHPGPLERQAHRLRTHHVLVLDGSLSMAAHAPDPGRLSRPAASLYERAKAALRDVIDNASPGDAFTLIHFALQPELVVPGPANDPTRVLAELDACQISHGSPDANALLNLIAEVLERSPRGYARRQVILATDLQRATWAPTLPPDDNTLPEAWSRLRRQADVVWLNLAEGERDNLAVVDLAIPDPLPFLGDPIIATVTVQNFGRSERRQVEVELEVERPRGSPHPPSPARELVTRQIEQLPPGEQATVTFTLGDLYGYQSAGPHVLAVRLRMPDALPEDNQRWQVVTARQTLQAAVVHGRADVEPLKRSGEYLARALSPPGVPPAQARVRVRSVSVAELADPLQGGVDADDVLFLCDVGGVTASLATRLEGQLRRGGGVVIGLGPIAADHRERYNRWLFADGRGLLPAALGEVVRSADEGSGFTLGLEDGAIRSPVLAAFASDAARASLTTVPLRAYVRLRPPDHAPVQRLLSVVAPRPQEALPQAPASAEQLPDPALLSAHRHRGRLLLLATTFNTEWTDWPLLPSYLPFVHELTRYAASSPDRSNLTVGQDLEEIFSPAEVGATARLEGPTGSESQAVALHEEVPLVRFDHRRVSGVYRLRVGASADRPFAVNLGTASPFTAPESDLSALAPADVTRIGVPIITEASSLAGLVGGDGPSAPLTPRPWGPIIARGLLLATLAVLGLELWLAWRLGPARTALRLGKEASALPRLSWPGRALGLGLWVALGVTAAALLALGLVGATGGRVESLPASWRSAWESAVGLTAAGPGEGTRWHLQRSPVFSTQLRWDRWLTWTAAIAGVVAIAGLYARERRAIPGTTAILLPTALRLMVWLGLLTVLLPQLRLNFDREGWPDIVILLDRSASMGTVDNLQDPAVRAKAAELTHLAGLPSAHRLQLAQALLLHPQPDWLERLLTDRQMRVHVYSVAEELQPLGILEAADHLDALRQAIRSVRADGSTSRLGDGIKGVLNRFRGSSLAGIIFLTDGITTEGSDLAHAARDAAREGVPLLFIGLGDAYERPNLTLSDLQVDDALSVQDEAVFQLRLQARGKNLPSAIPVILWEKQGGSRVERGRVTVSPGATGQPVPIEFRITLTEPGEHDFIIETPPLEGETDVEDNRLERVMVVNEHRQTRVLLIAGTARFEYRFLKALLERERDVRGQSAVDLKVLLLDASVGWAETDRSALSEMPTREQLFEYDVVILCDVHPRQWGRSAKVLDDLAEFVSLRGGGLIFQSGDHAGAGAYRETSLAEVLPVIPLEESAGAPGSAGGMGEGYRLALTPTGLTHPLFRLGPSEVESRRLFAALQPMFGFDTSYRRKLAAEVLATHPTHPAENNPSERHPLVLQHFVGNGRVLFLGFDETWRWRWRNDEEQFNRFWKQALRHLARTRTGRIELRTDQQTPYRRDDTITLTVRFPDDAPAPREDQVVRVAVQLTPLHPQGEASEAGVSDLELSRVPGSRGTYQGKLSRTPEGRYQFWLSSPEVAGQRPRAEAKVLPPLGELDNLEPNRRGMMEAARESRGRFATLGEAEGLLDDLPDAPRVPLNQPCPPWPLWNQPLVYAWLAALLLGEWLWRKRLRLL